MANDLVTADDISIELCTVGGVEHDYRPYTYEQYRGGPRRTSLRCVWCHVVACGNYGEDDPCIEPYHHHAGHRSARGARWPLGGRRP